MNKDEKRKALAEYKRRQKEALLTDHGCDTEAVLTWLEDHGGSCDCEVLANIEEQFDN